MRKLFEKRLKVKGQALRIVEASYYEEKFESTCPVGMYFTNHVLEHSDSLATLLLISVFIPAKTIIRRISPEEKYLVVAKKMSSHEDFCEAKWIVIAIIDFEGIGEDWSDFAYRTSANLIGEHGIPYSRKCEANKTKDCKCQGIKVSYCNTYS